MRGPRRLLVRAALRLSRLTRGMTLGVRAVLLKDGGVLLVRHGYVPGWYLPGGGVEPGETVREALARELREEAGVALLAPPRLFSLYRNAGRDHVALFVGRDWERDAASFVPGLEIRDCGLFPLDRLPEDTTPATRARLDEVLNGLPPAPDW